MSIDRETVLHVAKLSRLELTEKEVEMYVEQLNRILGHIDQLNKANTNGVEPLAHPLGLTNVFRKDEVKPSLPREEALQNAPEKTDEAYKVPVVVDQS